MKRTRALAVLSAAAVLSGLAAAPAVAEPRTAHCARADRIAVPGVAYQRVACLADMTTSALAGTDYTDPADYAGLAPAGVRNPTGVPGIQVDGYFPDTSTSNTNHGWNHDAQFVIRLPDRWNGGYTDGQAPGDAIAEWNDRVTQLTLAAKAAVKKRYGHPARTTIATGISNGGYLVRWQLENHPELYQAGVDWEGTLFRAQGPNLLTYLPTALREYPKWQATGDPSAHDAMIAAGFAPGSEFLWPFHYTYYWDLTQRIYREELDPTYDGDLQAGIPFCASGTPYCDADYDYFARPPAVRDAVARVSLTGNIGKPLITLHGTLDSLLPIRTDSDIYSELVTGAGHGAEFRYYRIADGNHVDGLYDFFPDRLRPLLPCWRSAFTAMTGWLHGTPPPASHTVADPHDGSVVDSCQL
jgi:hypothetical protein